MCGKSVWLSLLLQAVEYILHSIKSAYQRPFHVYQFYLSTISIRFHRTHSCISSLRFQQFFVIYKYFRDTHVFTLMCVLWKISNKRIEKYTPTLCTQRLSLTHILTASHSLTNANTGQPTRTCKHILADTTTGWLLCSVVSMEHTRKTIEYNLGQFHDIKYTHTYFMKRALLFKVNPKIFICCPRICRVTLAWLWYAWAILVLVHNIPRYRVYTILNISLSTTAVLHTTTPFPTLTF